MSAATAASPSTKQYFSTTDFLERISQGSFVLKYTVPANLFDGNYIFEITTTLNYQVNTKEYNVQVKSKILNSDSDYSILSKSISVNSRSKYASVDQYNTNNLLLIGHTDAIERYGITKIASMQDAINVLRADMKSPLLRGVFDAYTCGARDIFIMSAGPMSEYVSDVAQRNVKISKDDVNVTYSFYENYYNSLAKCYSLVQEYDYIDIIVPLEASMINTRRRKFR